MIDMEWGGKRMIVGIDGRLLCGNRPGMGMSLYNILLNLVIPNGNLVYLYVPDCLDDESEICLKRNNIITKPLGKAHVILWEQVILPKVIKKDKVDVFWFNNNTGSFMIRCKKIVTINDMIAVQDELVMAYTWRNRIMNAYYKFTVLNMIKSSDSIITISKMARNEILSYFPDSAEKVTVVYIGGSYSTDALDKATWNAFRKDNNLQKKYILAFASHHKRKNTLRVIKAFEKSTGLHNTYDLVFFGYKGWETSMEYQYIKENNLTNIYMFSYVSEAEKNSLYQHSECFVFPSLAEGFGMPLLEAYFNKTVLVTSNLSSMPEIAGNAAIFVDPYSVESIMSGIEEAVTLGEKRADHIKDGLNQLKNFDWKDTAHNIQKIIFKQ